MSDPIQVENLRREAVCLAGGLGDLAQRASVYHHIFRHSAGNHVFPLLAAHGALWAGGYFKRGVRGGQVLQWLSPFSPRRRRARMKALLRFADAFREINRRVCVETYFIYHLTLDRRFTNFAEQIVPAPLLSAMRDCHAAGAGSRTLSDAERRRVFEAFFLWEQHEIVGPAVNAAFKEFRWRPVRDMALRPNVRFAYLGKDWTIQFRDFSSLEERVVMGLRAFDAGASVGWTAVEQSLEDYGLLPPHSLRERAQQFSRLRDAVISGLQPP